MATLHFHAVLHVDGRRIARWRLVVLGWVAQWLSVPIVVDVALSPPSPPCEVSP